MEPVFMNLQYAKGLGKTYAEVKDKSVLTEEQRALAVLYTKLASTQKELKDYKRFARGIVE